MKYPMKDGNLIQSNVREYYIDTVSGLTEIPVNECATGSIAFIINTGALYMLNENKEWKEQ